MDVRKGIIRAVAAFVLPWAAFWIWTYRDAINKAEYWDETRVVLVEQQADLTGALLLHQNDRVGAAAARVSEERNRQRTAVRVGLYYPAAALVVIALLYWVYRGFKPRN